MSQHFAVNLKFACSHYRSISEVCRLLAINRAQFNKYLSGQSQPTAHNLKRIGDFFGVEGYELNLPPEQFAELLGRSVPAATPSVPPALTQLLLPLLAHSSGLARYCGYYFEYSNCMSVPGWILLSLVRVWEEGGCFLFERLERQESTSSPDMHSEDWLRCRYLGASFQLQDRLFFMDYESITVNEMSHTILIPSFKSRITRLNGLKSGVASSDDRMPTCTRVVWEYLGHEINRANAYRQVRLYRPDDPRIDDDLRLRLAAIVNPHGLFEGE